MTDPVKQHLSYYYVWPCKTTHFTAPVTIYIYFVTPCAVPLRHSSFWSSQFSSSRLAVPSWWPSWTRLQKGHQEGSANEVESPPQCNTFKMVNALNGAAHRGVECTWNALPLEDLHWIKKAVWIGSDGGWGNMERPERAILVNCAKEKNAA